MGIIYLITNTINGHRYVGQSKKTLEQRFQRHKYHAINPKTYLHRAMSKYGFDAFEVTVLEETDTLSQRERHWIAELKPEYNMTSGGEGGDTSNSPNYKEGMKQRRSFAGENNPMFGRKRPDTAIYLAACKEKMIQANRCPVVCEGTEYPSVAAAQEAYPGRNIRKRLDNSKFPEFYRLRERTRRK